MDAGPDDTPAPAGHAPPVAAVELPPRPDAPRVARRFVAETLRGRVGADTLDTALLLVSELVTNAVVHAGTAATVEIEHTDPALHVRVVDRHAGRIESGDTGREAAVLREQRAGREDGPGDGPREGESLQEGGRGLALVDALASAWGTEHRADGKAVWFRLAADPDENGTAAPAPPPAVPVPSGVAPVLPLHEELLGRISPADGVQELLHRLLDVLPARRVVARRSEGHTVVAVAGEDEPAAGPLRLPLDAGDRVVGELELWPASLTLSPTERGWLRLVRGRMALALRLAELRAADERRTGMLSFLAEASELLAGSLDVGHTFALLAQLPVPRLADWAAVRTVGDDQPAARVLTVAHRDESRADPLRERLDGTIGPLDALERTALADGRPLTGVLAVGPDGEHQAVLVAPLRARRRLLGTLLVGRAGGRPFRGDEVDLIDDLARRAALAADNARLYEEQVRVARALQEWLLPPALPTVAGLDLGASYRAAGAGLDVGGDFYDLTAAADGQWSVSIGDVCGKGAEAAAVTGVARDVLRLLHREGRPLPEALLQVNRSLRDQGDRSRFATVAVARLRPGPAGTEVGLCLAGHPQPVLVRADGTASQVGTPGTLLGLLEEDDLSLTEVSVRLAPGDALVFYTDGVTEARAGERLFGEARLLETLAGQADRPAQRIADALREAATRFAGSDLRDDLAVLVVRAAPDVQSL